MNIGKTLFAQVMDFLPWKTFQRIAEPLRIAIFMLPIVLTYYAWKQFV